MFDSFAKLRVLIIGDVMIDSYVWGKVTRISPEAPVPIVSVVKKEKRLGGAANVALNVQSLGATPILCSVIGADFEGQQFLELMQQQKLAPKGIMRSRERITTTKTRVMGNKHHLLRVDEEIDHDITAQETQQFMQRIAYLLDTQKIDVIIFEDYDKGLITESLIRDVVNKARRLKVPVVVDPKKKHFMSYRNVSLFKPNLKELKEGLKIDFDPADEKELRMAVELLKKKLKCDTALITLSEHGIYIHSKKTKALLPAHVRNIADVSGAGDTVVSVAGLCTGAKLKPEMVAAISNIAGGLVCEKVGVVPINREMLLEETIRLIGRK
ncbi:MAG: ADP-heptose synthase, bifunctional sugar kinase/adenylyltransferase [Bacteroidetes bacterium]|nr:MAG: ADP-heptose synthase, bifunctional sugar kinase/adenylyltransferase [Bacteroidota bacterium]